MNPIQLAGLIKRIYSSLDITKFDDRLKLQKSIYLLQESGLNLGYNFRLYLRGPYCLQLARDSFDMPKIDEVATLKFEDVDAESKFKELNNFISDIKDAAEKMEVIASLHLFHKLFPDKKDGEIIQLVQEKNASNANKKEMIISLLSKLKQSKVIKW